MVQFLLLEKKMYSFLLARHNCFFFCSNTKRKLVCHEQVHFMHIQRSLRFTQVKSFFKSIPTVFVLISNLLLNAINHSEILFNIVLIFFRKVNRVVCKKKTFLRTTFPTSKKKKKMDYPHTYIYI